MFLYDKGFPEILDMPNSPVHKALKFSAVLGTTFLNNSNSILFGSYSPIAISK